MTNLGCYLYIFLIYINFELYVRHSSRDVKQEARVWGCKEESRLKKIKMYCLENLQNQK